MPPKVLVMTLLTVAIILRLGEDTSMANLDL
jgi:hypothetical protein